jgi:hypothetical protein
VQEDYRLAERPAIPQFYRMTPKSFLGGCGCREDIDERIQRFRRVVAAAPPAIWEDFFARTLARIAPLNPELDYVVLKVRADEEIRRLPVWCPRNGYTFAARDF